MTSAAKSNGLVCTLPVWDEAVAERAAGIRTCGSTSNTSIALAAKCVLKQERFDVGVASSLFGDILSDLAAALTRSIGIAPSVNLDPTRQFPSMAEPVHGSGHDIAGRGIANPIGAFWTATLMFEHLGDADAAGAVIAAIEPILADPATRTGDLQGRASTAEVTDALVAHLR